MQSKVYKFLTGLVSVVFIAFVAIVSTFILLFITKYFFMLLYNNLFFSFLLFLTIIFLSLMISYKTYTFFIKKSSTKHSFVNKDYENLK